MSVNKKLAIAALTGLLSASSVMTAATVAHATSNDQVMERQVAQNDPAIEKHACKGQNSCKGNGGGDKEHWGKNSCKGQGSCATDGSK